MDSDINFGKEKETHFSIILLNGEQWNFCYCTIRHLRAKIASRLGTISNTITLMHGNLIIDDTIDDDINNPYNKKNENEALEYKNEIIDYSLHNSNNDDDLKKKIENGVLDYKNKIIDYANSNNDDLHSNNSILFIFHSIKNENIEELQSNIYKIGKSIVYHIEINDKNIIQWVRNNFDITVVYQIIRIAWLYAASSGSIKAIKYFLNTIVQSLPGNDLGEMIIEPIDSFIEMDIECRENEFHGDTALILASRFGNLAVVDYLLKHSADIDYGYYDSGSDPPLEWASREGHLPIVKRLLSVHHYKQEEMYFSLKIVCDIGHISIVQHLLDKHVDINYTTIGWNAAMSAAYNGHTDILVLLIQAQININFQNDSHGDTALLIASKRHFDIVHLLITNGALIDVQNHLGCTALMNTVSVDRVDLTRYLLEAHANIELKNWKGESVLDLAQQKNCLHIFRTHCAEAVTF